MSRTTLETSWVRSFEEIRRSLDREIRARYSVDGSKSPDEIAKTVKSYSDSLQGLGNIFDSFSTTPLSDIITENLEFRGISRSLFTTATKAILNAGSIKSCMRGFSDAKTRDDILSFSSTWEFLLSKSDKLSTFLETNKEFTGKLIEKQSGLDQTVVTEHFVPLLQSIMENGRAHSQTLARPVSELVRALTAAPSEANQFSLDKVIDKVFDVTADPAFARIFSNDGNLNHLSILTLEAYKATIKVTQSRLEKVEEAKSLMHEVSNLEDGQLKRNLNALMHHVPDPGVKDDQFSRYVKATKDKIKSGRGSDNDKLIVRVSESAELIQSMAAKERVDEYDAQVSVAREVLALPLTEKLLIMKIAEGKATATDREAISSAKERIRSSPEGEEPDRTNYLIAHANSIFSGFKIRDVDIYPTWYQEGVKLSASIRFAETVRTTRLMGIDEEKLSSIQPFIKDLIKVGVTNPESRESIKGLVKSITTPAPLIPSRPKRAQLATYQEQCKAQTNDMLDSVKLLIANPEIKEVLLSDTHLDALTESFLPILDGLPNIQAFLGSDHALTDSKELAKNLVKSFISDPEQIDRFKRFMSAQDTAETLGAIGEIAQSPKLQEYVFSDKTSTDQFGSIVAQVAFSEPMIKLYNEQIKYAVTPAPVDGSELDLSGTAPTSLLDSQKVLTLTEPLKKFVTALAPDRGSTNDLIKVITESMGHTDPLDKSKIDYDYGKILDLASKFFSRPQVKISLAESQIIKPLVATGIAVVSEMPQVKQLLSKESISRLAEPLRETVEGLILNPSNLDPVSKILTSKDTYGQASNVLRLVCSPARDPADETTPKVFDTLLSSHEVHDLATSQLLPLMGKVDFTPEQIKGVSKFVGNQMRKLSGIHKLSHHLAESTELLKFSSAYDRFNKNAADIEELEKKSTSKTSQILQVESEIFRQELIVEAVSLAKSSVILLLPEGEAKSKVVNIATSFSEYSKAGLALLRNPEDSKNQDIINTSLSAMIVEGAELIKHSKIAAIRSTVIDTIKSNREAAEQILTPYIESNPFCKSAGIKAEGLLDIACNAAVLDKILDVTSSYAKGNKAKTFYNLAKLYFSSKEVRKIAHKAAASYFRSPDKASAPAALIATLLAPSNGAKIHNSKISQLIESVQQHSNASSHTQTLPSAAISNPLSQRKGEGRR